MKFTIYAIELCLLMIFGLLFLPMDQIETGQAKTNLKTETAFVIPEGYDFATRILRDPWDMLEFTDVSSWFNHNGSEHFILNHQVDDGVFSGHTASGLTYFFLLYGGYEPGLRNGDIGRLYPIPTNQFSCFSMAMRADTQDIDYFQFTWGDEYLPPTVSGMPYGLRIAPQKWRLYQVDLKTWPYISGTSWLNRSQWQALKITPSLSSDVDFYVDWARLTNCEPVNITLTGIPSGRYSLWIGTGNPERRIEVKWDFSPNMNGSYTVDLQGVAPGEYIYYLTSYLNSNDVIQQGSLEVVQTSVIKFTHPSPMSGDDYATLQGNPWDFEQPADAPQIDCASYSFQGGSLSIDTLPPELAPECVGAGVMDPMIYLDTRTPTDIRPYRYLSFRHSLAGAWSHTVDGMVVRWVWGINRSGKTCYYYSREVELDVGWQVYTIDLYNDWNSTPATVWPSDCSLVRWKDETGSIFMFRFEPNENITDFTLHQEIDWIRLTKVDQVRKGQAYTVKATLNVPFTNLQSIVYYYTDDLNNPTQHIAVRQTTLPPSFDSYFTFLPLLTRSTLDGSVFTDPFKGDLAPDISFAWDTSNVNLGAYYLCAQADDGYNQAIYCSDAPVQVIAP